MNFEAFRFMAVSMRQHQLVEWNIMQRVFANTKQYIPQPLIKAIIRQPATRFANKCSPSARQWVIRRVARRASVCTDTGVHVRDYVCIAFDVNLHRVHAFGSVPRPRRRQTNNPCVQTLRPLNYKDFQSLWRVFGVDFFADRSKLLA